MIEKITLLWPKMYTFLHLNCQIVALVTFLWYVIIINKFVNPQIPGVLWAKFVDKSSDGKSLKTSLNLHFCTK